MRAVAALVLLVLAAAPARAHDLAVYKGAGCEGRRYVPNFERWLGRPVDRVIDFLARDSWEKMLSSARWISGCWREAGREPVLSVPMLPEGKGHSLAAGAAGAYDRHFRDLARLLVADGHGGIVLRLGWEFNGGWYPWAAARDPEAWVACWRRIVTVMRSVPGADFRFDWNPVLGRQQIPPDRVYPGDAFVDVIGLDAYNQTWNDKATTPAARWADLMDQPFGLSWHARFAAARGKPLSFAEWGTGDRADGHGGGDDPHYIARMAEWMAAHPVLYHGYWDFPAHDYDARLSDGGRPAAGAAFIRLFGR